MHKARLKQGLQLCPAQVLGAKRLMPDPEENVKKKHGKNVARGNVSLLLDFMYPDGVPLGPVSMHLSPSSLSHPHTSS